MSSLRTMVDRLDEGDSFTYALVAIAELGQNVAEIAGIAEEHRPPLHVVSDDQVGHVGTEDDGFLFALLGLHALSKSVLQLLPAAGPEEASSVVVVPGPRELLR